MTSDSSTTLRRASSLLAALLVLPLFALWVAQGPSMFGWLYLGSFLCVFVAAVLEFNSHPRWKIPAVLAVVLFGVAFAGRLASATGSTMVLERVGEERAVISLLNRAAPERDLALVGGWLGMRAIHTIEISDELLPALSAGYEELRETEGEFASPWFATYTGAQSAASFDVLTHEVAEATDAVVFLHGFGGNYTLLCWEVAQAAALSGVSTYCPSTNWIGAWWREDGVATVHAALALARERGHRRLVLAGLSNGGITLSRLASEFDGSVAGYILISGVAPDAGAPTKPTLVLHGRSDRMTSAALSREFANASDLADYIEFETGHYMLVEERARARASIAEWLRGLR